MDNTDYVSYEQAVKLKECGFDWKCNHFYQSYEYGIGAPKLRRNCSSGNLNKLDDNPDYYERCGFICSAPLLWEAQKWLREKKKIDVLVWNCACGYGWEVSKAGDEQTRGTTLINYDDNGEDDASGMWLSYENALYAGISAALELIGKKD